MIYGERFRQVREMHRLTQAGLAEQVPGLSQWRLSRIETDRAVPDDEATALLALSSGVTVDFFARPPVPSLLAHSPQLRARSRLTETAKVAAMQWARLIDEAYLNMRAQANSLPVTVTPMPEATPAEAARAVRAQLGFRGDEPLPYLVLAVERVGVTVLGLPCVIDGLDAFCAWRAGEPVIAVLSGAPGDRERFSIAHELGHLVLHHPRQAGRSVELEADEFAAELLVPLDAVARDMPENPTLNSLAMLKTTWGVSIKSLVRRARELELIDQDRAITLYKQMSARGWNRYEPGHVPYEKPRAFRKLAEILYGPGPNVQRFAAAAGWSEKLALDILSHYAAADELPHQPPARPSGNVVDLRPRLADRAAAARF